jgi:hypothetical protein
MGKARFPQVFRGFLLILPVFLGFLWFLARNQPLMRVLER